MTERERGSSLTFPCAICKDEIAVYRCPGCYERTCSLECCIEHKQKSGCNGKRNKVGFVPLNRFNDTTLSSDYHFLEDVLAKSERGKRLIKDIGAQFKSPSSKKRKFDSKKRNGANENDDESQSLPIQPLLKLQVDDNENSAISNEKCTSLDASVATARTNPIINEERNNDIGTLSSLKLSIEEERILANYPPNKQRLVRQARQRGIRLLLMAPGMQRHVMNKSTKYDSKKDIINWKVEFVIHSFSASTESDHQSTKTESFKLILTCDRIPESDALNDHLSKLFERNTSHSAPSLHRSTLIQFCNVSNTKVINRKVCVLMKKIPCKSSQPSFSRIDLNKTLKEILQQTTVIEFPTFDIVLEEHMKKFPIFIDEVIT